MKIPPELLAAASHFGLSLLHSLWQGAVIALLVAIGLRVLPARYAAVRHAVTLLALFAMPVAMGVTFFSSFAPRATLSAGTVVVPLPGQVATRPVSVAFAVDPDEESLKPPPEPAPAAAPKRKVDPSLPWLSAAWVAGVLLLSLRHVGGWWRIHALRRSGRPATPAVRAAFLRLLEGFDIPASRLHLLEVACGGGPMLVGAIKPAVLLPLGVVTGLPAREMEAILAHEIAHFLRCDHWSNLAQVVIETWFFYHPAVWWIGHCARREREHATDDLTLRAGSERQVYARALARLAGLPSAPSAGVGATSGGLLTRIQRLLNPTAPVAGGWPSAGLALAILAVAITVPLALAEKSVRISVKPGESIQAAIDRAPAGATVHLAAGEYRERVEIAKPLNLEGEGEAKTTLFVEEPDPAEGEKSLSAANARRTQASTPAEKDAANLAWIREVERPAILVREAKGVTLSGLRVQGASSIGRPNLIPRSTLIDFLGAQAKVIDCTVAGPFGGGVAVAGGSEVEIRRSLIAGFWGTGVRVLGRMEDGSIPPGRLHLVDSEVRNCYHRGVTIGPGCDTTVIERNRISGSAWHGIRYDDASPAIIGNAIFKNARSGIYASGATRATVRGNLFWANEMGGISCWSGNADQIEGNTFAGNRREGMGVITAQPNVTGNIFAHSPIAIACGGIQRRDGSTTAIGQPAVGKNLFWESKVAVQVGERVEGPPAGSLTENPLFADPARADFTLAADSPALAAGLGAAKPLSPVSPRALLAGEKSIIPADDTREFTFWTAPGEAKPPKAAAQAVESAQKAASAWVADAMQLDDAAKRAAALDRIKAALNGGADGERLAGLAAFLQVTPVEFDRTQFRPPLRKLLRAENPAVRARACSALSATGPSDEDLALVLPLADDPSDEVRQAVPFAIKWLAKDGFTGPAGETILKLLDRPDGKSTGNIWHAMWGTKISPELERRVVEASRRDDRGTGYSEVFYFALCVHQSKREPTVTRLIELAASPDPVNVGQRVLWGIRQGLAEDQKPRVAELALRVLDARSDGAMRKEALACLRDCGTAANIPAVDKLLARPGVTGDFRAALEETRKTLQGRGG